jgi:hypothetical protein
MNELIFFFILYFAFMLTGIAALRMLWHKTMHEFKCHISSKSSFSCFYFDGQSRARDALARDYAFSIANGSERLQTNQQIACTPIHDFYNPLHKPSNRCILCTIPQARTKAYLPLSMRF